MNGLSDPGTGGSVAGRLPFGKKVPVQPSETAAEAIVLFVVVKPTVRSNAEKFMVGSELTVTMSEMGGAETYVVPATVRLAVPELEEY